MEEKKRPELTVSLGFLAPIPNNAGRTGKGSDRTSGMDKRKKSVTFLKKKLVYLLYLDTKLRHKHIYRKE